MINAAFIAAMENILQLYALPYDPSYPLISFDERPCFLIGDRIEGLQPKPGQVRKEHYEYKKNGSCVLFAAIEPLTGLRIAKVYSYRRKIEYADFMQMVATYFPEAKKIRVIQDNLNTHNASSFYENFDAQTAFELNQRFEFHYTPKKGLGSTLLNQNSLPYPDCASTGEFLQRNNWKKKSSHLSMNVLIKNSKSTGGFLLPMPEEN